MDNQYRLSDEEHQQVFEKIKKDFLNNSLSVVNPKVVITGGQPASGKGKLARDAIDEFKDKGGSVIIDPDQLRSYHPKYDHLQNLDDKTSAGYTHHDAKKWSLELIEEATAHKKNIVLDQTSADFDTLKNTVQNFRDKGYKSVELKIMSVPEMTSRQGIYHRYEMEKSLYGTGRFVNVDIHNEIYNKLEKTVERLKDDQIVDKLTVYDRHYKTIEQKDFTLERNRDFTEQERQQHEYKWFKVIEAMESRFAPFTELEIVRALQENDRLKLNNQYLMENLNSSVIQKGENMEAKTIANLTQNLMVTNDGFEKHDGYISKNLDLNGEKELIIFRQNDDRIELINVTQNNLMYENEIGKFDPKDSEKIALETYAEVKKSISMLEQEYDIKSSIHVRENHNDLFADSKLRSAQFIISNDEYKLKTAEHEKPENTVRLSVVPDYDKPDFYKLTAQHNIYDPIKDDYRIIQGLAAFRSIGVKPEFDLDKLYNKPEISKLMEDIKAVNNMYVSERNNLSINVDKQLDDKNTQVKLSKDQIINDVRVHLKTEGKLGADFAKSANGVAVARGDYIKLTEAYSQKDGLFKSTELPKGAEVRITGHTSKKGETYATGTYNNREVELKIRNVQASYGDQYQKQYENNPKVKQAIDQKATAQQNNLKAPVTPKAQELSASTPKQDKPSSRMKF
ncbi:zeta toxin family protein [Acinetobacter baumannii]|uniref:zeta toxin family protein n=1 Tax=Acinetobacter baumannii TaxID=470 RepID=UPI000A93723A|nr:zeta toxin family protein [Acinetobacter baumannii]MCZ0638424.1 zeta toxin family protein [Acinetobacter baumannii]